LTVHDLLVFDRPADYPVAKRVLIRAPFAAAIRRASVILADSHSTADRLARAFADVVHRTTVVPLAVSPQLLTAEEESVRALAGRRFALVVGDASPRKNLQLVVDAWPSVLRSAPDAVLAVVGPPGWGTDTRGAAFDSLVSSGSIVALGHVSDAQLAWLYRNCRVTLCPSLVEGFGLPAAEAVAFGSALIRTADPAMREAAGGLGVERRGDDERGWVQAILQMLDGRPGEMRPTSARTWDEVVSESVAAVHRGARG
jgi:glycosyltransferase involved in cell wall biosynthesis